MRRYILLFFALLVFTSSARATPWALVIGISNYEEAKNIRALPTADTDAKFIAKTLREVWQVPESNVTLLTSDGPTLPTRSQILTSLSAVKRQMKPGDTIFVYFAGRALEYNRTTYLLPHDFRAGTADYNTDTALPTTALAQMLERLQGGTVFFAWDISRENPFPQPLLPEPPAEVRFNDGPHTLPVLPRTTPSSTQLFAGLPRQPSQVWATRQQSYFSYYLAEGLRNKLDAAALGTFVIKAISTHAPRSQKALQTPYMQLTGAQR